MQDVNQIIDILNGEWASDAINMKKRIAILTEENIRLKNENEQLKNEEEKEGE